jgi:diguanylate cyclase (GGDEF)-like protein
VLVRGALGPILLEAPVDAFRRDQHRVAAFLTHGFLEVVPDSPSHRRVDAPQQREQLLLYLANHDAATALPNRATLYQLLGHAIRHGQRYGHCAAALFLDVDDFKDLNDTAGHLDADRVISDIADRLARCVRSVDTVGRYGGDEFVIVLSAVNDATEIEVVLKKIMAAFREPFHAAGRAVRLTCSVGAATYPTDGSDAQSLLHLANHAMFRVKSEGKNGYCFHGAYHIQRL